MKFSSSSKFYFLLFCCMYVVSLLCVREEYILLQQNGGKKDDDGILLMHIKSFPLSFLFTTFYLLFPYTLSFKGRPFNANTMMATTWDHRPKGFLVNPSSSVISGFDLGLKAFLLRCSTFFEHDLRFSARPSHLSSSIVILTMI